MFNLLVYINLVLVPIIFVPSLVLPFEISKIIIFRSLTLLMMLAYVFELIQNKKLVIYDIFANKNLRKIILGFLIVLILGVILSVAPRLSLWGSYFRQQGAISWLFYFIFFGLVSLNFHKKEQWSKAMSFMYMGLSLVVLFAINQRFSLVFDSLNMDIDERSMGRISSTLGHPSYLATYIVMVIFPLLSTYLIEKNKRHMSLFMTSIVILFFTGSRAGILGGLIGAFLYVLLYSLYVYNGRYRNILVTLMIVAMLGAGLSGRLNPTDENLRSIKSRLDVWPATLEMVAERPFFGYGIESFPLVFSQYADPSLLNLERTDITFDRAHNNLLDILSQVGLIGLIYYFVVIFWVLKQFFTRIKTKKEDEKKKLIGVLSGLCAAFVSNFFGFQVTATLVIGSFLLAYLLYLLSDQSHQKAIRFFDNRFYTKALASIVVVFVFGSIVFQNIFIGIADYKATQGFKALAQGDAKSVVSNFSEATVLWPNQSYYYFVLAEVLIQTREWELANKYTELGGAFSSFRDNYYFLLKGKILGGKGEVNLANEAFTKAYKLAPTYPPILLSWGIMYIENKDCEAGLKKLEQYLALVPEDWKNPGTENYRLFYKHNPTFDEVFKYQRQCDINN